MTKFFIILIIVVMSVVSQDQGTISPDTLIPERTVVVPKKLDGLFWERTYSGDSLVKFNDKFIVRFLARRAGTTINFDSTFVIIQPKTRRIDTLNGNRGYIWRIRFELLPR